CSTQPQASSSRLKRVGGVSPAAPAGNEPEKSSLEKKPARKAEDARRRIIKIVRIFRVRFVIHFTSRRIGAWFTNGNRLVQAVCLVAYDRLRGAGMSRTSEGQAGQQGVVFAAVKL